MLLKLIPLLLSVVHSLKVGSVIVGYYTDWSSSFFPPSSINFRQVTHINYAFANFDPNTFQPIITNPINLQDVVWRAHQNGVKVLVSVGGWTYSQNFSPMVANPNSRSKFISNFDRFVREYNLDGIDFDWEYPGKQGAPDNIVDPFNDTNNFLVFLKELRQCFQNRNLLITAAVSVYPFESGYGPIADSSGFAQVFDYINIMSYDVHGPWTTTTGPVGGLDFEVGKGVPLSIKQALKAWELSRFPKSKLVVGVPFYGYGWVIQQYNSQNLQNQYANVERSLDAFTFSQLVSNGYLSSPDRANTNSGWNRYFDGVTNTPWLYHNASRTLITYDDPRSLKTKSNYVKCNGYLGTMIWALTHDYNGVLLNNLQGDVSYDDCNGQPPIEPPITTTTTPEPTPPTQTPTTTPDIPTTTTTKDETKPLPTGIIGASCSNEGYQRCVSSIDNNPDQRTYILCIYGKWIVQDSCPLTTVCKQLNNNVYCGFPYFNIAFNHRKQKVLKVHH